MKLIEKTVADFTDELNILVDRDTEAFNKEKSYL